jgi:hypothetical protein
MTENIVPYNRPLARTDRHDRGLMPTPPQNLGTFWPGYDFRFRLYGTAGFCVLGRKSNSR